MADLKVVPIRRSEQAKIDNLEVIRLLEQALEHAKNGDCHSVAVILLDSDGNAIDCWHNGGRPYVMVGAIESLKSEFISTQIERR